MNTIERIEARAELHALRAIYHVTADEWSAIKAVIEAAETAHILGTVGSLVELGQALSKLEN